MVDAHSYKQMSDGGATDQQQYMMQDDGNQYVDEFGNEIMGQNYQQQMDGMQQEDGYAPVNALVSSKLLPTRLVFNIFHFEHRPQKKCTVSTKRLTLEFTS